MEIQWIQVILVGEPLKRYDAKRQSRAQFFLGVRVNWLRCKKKEVFLMNFDDIWIHLRHVLFFFLRAFIESSLFKVVVNWNSCNLF